MKPFFSIVVPIYRVEKYLKKCIDSILAQTYEDFEVILVDDGSPDGCPAICDEYKKADPRVVVIHKPNGGLVSARNAGIHAAKGEYICYVDGDDWVSERMLASVYDEAIKNYNPDIVVFEAEQVLKNRTEKIDNYPLHGFYDKQKLKKICQVMIYDPKKPFCTGLVYPAAWNKIYRKELILKCFCRDERIGNGEDHAFTYECIYRAGSACFLNESLYYYNKLNTGAMTSNYDPGWFRNLQYLEEYLSKRFSGTEIVKGNQIEALKISYLIIGVFNEPRYGRPLAESARHIRTEIAHTKLLKGISAKGLPFTVKGYVLLLKCHFYCIALILAKIALLLRRKKQ